MAALSRLFRRHAGADESAQESIVIDGPDGPIEIALRRHPTAVRMILRLCRRTGRPQMTVPRGLARTQAKNFARSRLPWIVERLTESASIVVPADGVVIPLRGVDHVIRHRPDSRGAARLSPDGSVIIVPGPPDAVGRRVSSFLKKEARRDLSDAVDRFARDLDVRAARISIRDTTSRWGSCSNGRVLSFSWRLIMAPPFVLHYVAAHEVAHLREMNHGPAFWALVADLDPNMDAARCWLRENGAGLHRIVPA